MATKGKLSNGKVGNGKPQTAATPLPNLGYEVDLWRAGYVRVAGIDEAGRGALAGPVVAAAAILPCAAFAGDDPHAAAEHPLWGQVRDSKLLRPAQRAILDVQIRQQAQATGIGAASPQEIDCMGIAVATRIAMLRALEQLAAQADFLLIDWVRLAQCPIPQHSFAKADQISISVAAASILAKVARDALMVELDRAYPIYGFARHKGYAAPAHLRALEQAGPCVEHRHSFAPVARQATLFDTLPNINDAQATQQHG